MFVKDGRFNYKVFRLMKKSIYLFLPTRVVWVTSDLFSFFVVTVLERRAYSCEHGWKRWGSCAEMMMMTRLVILRNENERDDDEIPCFTIFPSGVKKT